MSTHKFSTIVNNIINVIHLFPLPSSFFCRVRGKAEIKLEPCIYQANALPQGVVFGQACLKLLVLQLYRAALQIFLV